MAVTKKPAKKRVRKKPLPKFAPCETAEDVLSVIRAFMNKKSESWAARTEKKRLWNILTALRGPDDSKHQVMLKQSTTAIIRAVAIGRNFASPFPIDVNVDSKERATFRSSMSQLINVPNVPQHFLSHAQDAFNALNLSWHESNYGKEKP